jgi:formate/nitrite transporter FocA (FNT family)
MAKDLKLKKTEEEIIERTSPPGEVLYLAVQGEGEHELERSSLALGWSGLAAGLSMGFSMIMQAYLRVYLPEAHWQPLLTNFGYTIGFLIVVLGRQQLFTENTLTPVLPLLKKTTVPMFFNVARLWIVVLVSNLVGAFIFACLVAHTAMVDIDVREACLKIGLEAVQFGFGTTLLRAIFAGWLIALMVWLLPFAESARVEVIIIITYLIGVGHFPHIIAGSVKVFYLVATSQISFVHSVAAFLVPTFIGNVIGGVALVAALNHAQFMATGQTVQK